MAGEQTLEPPWGAGWTGAAVAMVRHLFVGLRSSAPPFVATHQVCQKRR